MNPPRGERWYDRDAGPVVRPYALTRGRTMPASEAYVGLIDMVIAQEHFQLPEGARLNSEHRRLLAMCRHPGTVVDVASDAGLPVGVVRVPLSDLAAWGAIRVRQAQRGRMIDERLLKDVLDGLQAL
jgi:Protein of unknown function (DUF742)